MPSRCGPHRDLSLSTLIITVVNDRTQLGWLARRIGFGLAPGQLDEWERLGTNTVIDHLTDGDAFGVDTPDDPFAGLERRTENVGEGVRAASLAWLLHSVETPRPFESWVTFFWHDYFAVSAPLVRRAGFIHDHFRLMANQGLGNFKEYLRAMTTDAAMLIFLDGTRSTGENPNENYGREMLELYSVGVGKFNEADVAAASVALTGWVARARVDRVQFVAARHDDTPQTLLGVSGVNNVDSVVGAATSHPACAQRVAKKVAGAILGPGADQGVVSRRADDFAESLELRPLFRGLIEDALDGAAKPVIIEPVAWFLSCMKATGAVPRTRNLGRSFAGTGQVPFNPPNVGGFPPQSSYLSTSATVARFNMASALGTATPPDSAIRAAAGRGDLETLADAFGLESFSPSTVDAIRSLSGAVDVLSAVLASPDLIVA